MSLPRPKGTRVRAQLVITMHPKQLAQLQERADAANMSLTAYVTALLDSDGADIEPRPRGVLAEHIRESLGLFAPRDMKVTS